MTTTLEAPAAPVATPAATDAPNRWLGLMAILTATLLNLLDASIVNVALPQIQRDLGGSYASMQWIVAVYTLTLAAGLVTGGRFGDLYGRKRMLLSGAAGFLVASTICALAVSPEILIGGRAVQGLFAAAMVPQCFGLIRDLFPGEDQAKAWAVFGPAIGLATILGPVLAGLLIQWDPAGTGWRSIFLINLPLGAVALFAGRAALPNGKRGTGTLDILGTAIVATGMGLLVYPLVQGREQGWPLWLVAMVPAAVIVLGLFIAQQRKRTAKGLDPLVRLSVFGKRSYSSGVLFVVFFFMSIIGFSLAAGFLLQLGLGYSAMGASMAMSPWALGAFLGSAAGSMAPTLGRRILHVGLAVMIAGMVGVYTVFTALGTGVSGWPLAAPFLMAGLGMGMIFVPLFDIIMGEVADEEVGSASGALESIQQLAAALGVAVLGTVFFNRFAAAGAPADNALAATETVTLIAIVLAVIAFGLGFLLPKRARA
ncbi:MAG: MFS transporter [Mycobacteriaceae bacterium]|nr:MFS transporter [Mycobacteriaceae bacterium]